MMFGKTSVAVGLALAALGIAGCGAGKDKDRPSDSQVTATRESAVPVSSAASGSASGSASVSASASAAASAEAKDAVLSGLSLAKLNEREKATLAQAMTKLPSPCESTPVPLSQCLGEKRSCKLCKPAGELLGRLVMQGATDADLEAVYKARFDPSLVQTVEVGKAPFKGPENAPVTIVEFADFQCPGCREVRVFLDLLLERFPEQVRVVYKYYQIAGHDRSLEAAYAAHAADLQGKFWQMHELLFANKGALARSDFSKYATELALDLTKFNADFDSAATKKAVASDIAQADKLGLEYTPLLYVNGRQMTLNPYTDELEEWVKLEIEQAGKVPAAPSEKYEAMAKALRPPAPP